ncbi:phage tail protein [Paenibacillus sp. FSL M7-0547]|uniref:phage tail protein n=1 Tax=Paenibacillus sp. FSL M7-0547 TaxID=2954755 RepID=UPI0030FD0218
MNKLEVLDKNFVPTGKLVSSYEETRKRRINSDYEISFLVPMISEDYRDKIQLKGHVRDERGQFYVIQSRSRIRDGRKLTASIMCNHVMFKLMDFKFPYADYIDEAYGVHISRLTNLISAATGGRFIFSIDDTFDLYDVKDFGQGNCLVALNKVVEMYGCEVEPDNFVIHIKKRIGADNGHQYRLKKNIVSDQFKDDTSSLVTRMFAQMKDGTTWIGKSASILTNEERTLLEAVPGAIVNGVLQVNYLISPHVHEWSSNSVPFFDNEIIVQDIDPSIDEDKAVLDLLEATRKALREQEIPAFEVSVDGADLYKIDGEETKAGLGDTVYCHDPDMEMVNLSARITELTEYPYSMDKHAQATVANVMRRDERDIQSDLEKSKNTVQNLFSGGRIRAAAFEEFAHKAVIDINNSKTELIYPPEGGILAQDKNNPLRQVRLTSAGLGISTDGWNTLRAAITADGVLAEQVIGQFGNFVSMLIGEGNNVVQINPHGIAAGHANFNDSPFQVAMNGDVIARSIKLTGEIDNSKMYSSEIEGGIITGARIRTSPSGRRVEATVDGFKTYDSNNIERISIDTADTYDMGRMYFNGSSGLWSGAITGSSSLFQLVSRTDMQLAAISGRIFLQGMVDFDSASTSGLTMDKIEGLQSEIQSIWIALAGKASSYHSHSVSLPNHNHGSTTLTPSGGGTYPVS